MAIAFFPSVVSPCRLHAVCRRKRKAEGNVANNFQLTGKQNSTINVASYIYCESLNYSL